MVFQQTARGSREEPPSRTAKFYATVALRRSAKILAGSSRKANRTGVVLPRHGSRLPLGLRRKRQSEKDKLSLIEAQNILVFRSSDALADLGLRNGVILSTIRRQVARSPLCSFGSTGRRNSGASVAPVVKAQTVMESVPSKLSSCTTTTGRGLLA